jgi:hypothetical protein
VGYAVDNAGGLNSDLYFVNFTAGTFSLIGTVGITDQYIEGLALSPSLALYGIDGVNNLDLIDTTTGAPTLIGPTNGSIQSIHFEGSTLYGLDFSTQPFLDTINTSTGQVTQVVQAATVLNGAPNSLTFLNSTTAVFSTSNDELYSMNITTGTVTDYGNLGDLFDGIDYGSGGILYGGDDGGNLATINLATATATVYATNADGHNDILDIAIEPDDTPEPGTWALLGAGLVGLAFWKKRRKA